MINIAQFLYGSLSITLGLWTLEESMVVLIRMGGAPFMIGGAKGFMEILSWGPKN